MTTNKTDQDKDIEIRSDEIQEIMSHVPVWMIRYGISLILILFIVAGFITWFIQYPDIISGGAKITTELDNTKIVAKSSGEVVYLLPEGVNVKKGEKIAEIKSTLSVEAKDKLVGILNSVEESLAGDDIGFAFNDDNITFGSIENEYLELKKTVLDYHFFRSTNPLEFKITNFENQIKNHRNLKSVTAQQIGDQAAILEQAKNRYNSALTLYENKAISKADLYDYKERLAQVRSNISELKKASIQSAITITDLERQLYELKQQFSSDKNDFLTKIKSQISALRNTIIEWKNLYELRASHSGKIAYLQHLSINQYVESSTELIAVIPETDNFVGRLIVPSAGYGKIKKGQKVKVTLDNYPAHEFGQLEGIVTNVSLLANSNNYRVEFKLSNGMESTHGTTFKYLPEMSGVADIITEDLRLTQRIFSNLKVLFE